jgi:DNA polymerase III epsilon subunit-like protein
MDAAAFHNVKIPFPYAKLEECCKVYGIELGDAHDALADAIATAKLYRALLEDD